MEENGGKKEALMASVKNLPKIERIIRTILGIFLIIVGFYVHGFWKPLSLVLGLCFLFTAFIAY
jgi:sulfite exporter TauE/SafE